MSCAELENLLVRQGLYPVGQTLHDVCTQEIEDAITAHPMVRKAQCYTTPFGTVEVRLTQRVPIMRVVTEGESYFVDADRLQMPIRESVTTPVLLAVGAINPRMACHELADMALWIKHEAYWSERIASIHVTNPRYVYLVQKPDETKIILGDLTNYKGKLRKLHRLYTKGFEQIGWRTYKEIDLRYRGQVIGRKTED